MNERNSDDQVITHSARCIRHQVLFNLFSDCCPTDGGDEEDDDDDDDDDDDLSHGVSDDDDTVDDYLDMFCLDMARVFVRCNSSNCCCSSISI